MITFQISATALIVFYILFLAMIILDLVYEKRLYTVLVLASLALALFSGLATVLSIIWAF